MDGTRLRRPSRTRTRVFRRTKDQAFPGDQPHNCETDHRPFPTARRDDGTLILEPQTYRAQQMIDALNAELQQPRTEAQARLEYAFLVDFNLARVDGDVSIRQLQQTLNSWAKMIDRYFFFNALTRGSDPATSIIVLESAEYRLRYWLAFTGSERPTKAPVTLYRTFRGTPLEKLHLLHTLIHEMTHAYCHVFNANCPTDGGRLPLGHGAKNPRGDGHGPLWSDIFRISLLRVADWGREVGDVVTARPRNEGWYLCFEAAYIYYTMIFRPYEDEWNMKATYVRHGLLKWPVEPIKMGRDVCTCYESYFYNRAPDYKKVLIPTVLLILILDFFVSTFLAKLFVPLPDWVSTEFGLALPYGDVLFAPLTFLYVAGTLSYVYLGILFLVTDLCLSYSFYTAPLFTGCTVRRPYFYSFRTSPCMLMYKSVKFTLMLRLKRLRGPREPPW